MYLLCTPSRDGPGCTPLHDGRLRYAAKLRELPYASNSAQELLKWQYFWTTCSHPPFLALLRIGKQAKPCRGTPA